MILFLDDQPLGEGRGGFRVLVAYYVVAATRTADAAAVSTQVTARQLQVNAASGENFCNTLQSDLSTSAYNFIG
jgi:hypothetical protein